MVPVDLTRQCPHYHIWKCHNNNGRVITMDANVSNILASIHGIEKCRDMFISDILDTVYLHGFTQLRCQHVLALNQSNKTQQTSDFTEPLAKTRLNIVNNGNTCTGHQNTSSFIRRYIIYILLIIKKN